MSKSSSINVTSPAASIFYRVLGLCVVYFMAVETVDRIDHHNALNFATWVCMATGFMIAVAWPFLKGTSAPVPGKLRMVAFGFLVMAVVLLVLRMVLR